MIEAQKTFWVQKASSFSVLVQRQTPPGNKSKIFEVTTVLFETRLQYRGSLYLLLWRYSVTFTAVKGSQAVPARPSGKGGLMAR
jgi:hypothetical protein